MVNPKFASILAEKFFNRHGNLFLENINQREMSAAINKNDVSLNANPRSIPFNSARAVASYCYHRDQPSIGFLFCFALAQRLDYHWGRDVSSLGKFGREENTVKWHDIPASPFLDKRLQKLVLRCDKCLNLGAVDVER
ncbi:Uncharacterised protein at_DN0535 [Pycnogonum litorale]